jgi:aryl-alcohol dehydrogenase-like predicted oxidoreductase
MESIAPVRSDLQLSRIGLGAGTLGEQVGAADAHAIRWELRDPAQ